MNVEGVPIETEGNKREDAEAVADSNMAKTKPWPVRIAQHMAKSVPTARKRTTLQESAAQGQISTS